MANQIFANKAVLDPDGQSPRAVGRSWEIRQAVSEFRSSPVNVTPASAVIYGLPGAGKSTALHEVGLTLRRWAQTKDTDLRVFEIDCRSLDTEQDLWYEILHELDHDTAENTPPDKRKYTPLSWLTSETERLLRSKQIDIAAVLLDDIDTLAKPTTILERILYHDNERRGPRFGFVGTATHYRILEDSYFLKNRAFTSKITLNAPDRQSYREMLGTTVEAAFHDGVVSDRIIETLLDEYSRSDTIGTVVAILKRAGELAAAEELDRIPLEIIEKAQNDQQSQLRGNIITSREFDIHNQVLILELADREEPAMCPSTLYDMYATRLQHMGVEPLGFANVQDRLSGGILDPFVSIKTPGSGCDSESIGEIRLRGTPNDVYFGLANESFVDIPNSMLPDNVNHFEYFADPIESH